MSTVAEVIVALRCGLHVIVFSVMMNMCVHEVVADHLLITMGGTNAGDRLIPLLRELLAGFAVELAKSRGKSTIISRRSKYSVFFFTVSEIYCLSSFFHSSMYDAVETINYSKVLQHLIPIYFLYYSFTFELFEGRNKYGCD
jgi:hypothetical protein